MNYEVSNIYRSDTTSPERWQWKNPKTLKDQSSVVEIYSQGKKDGFYPLNVLGGVFVNQYQKEIVVCWHDTNERLYWNEHSNSELKYDPIDSPSKRNFVNRLKSTINHFLNYC